MKKTIYGDDTYTLLASPMVAGLRLVLSLSALTIILIDPSEPAKFVFETYTTLFLYTVYSGVILILTYLKIPLLDFIKPYFHWIDVGWYVILIFFSNGPGSIFFFFFFFTILNASFSYGFRSGLTVTLVSSLSFFVVGYLTSFADPDFELNRFLIRPVYLAVLGYMMAYWGNYEIEAKRRLALLREISIISNPRFGVDRTINGIIELLRDFYDADECFLVFANDPADENNYYHTDRLLGNSAVRPISQKAVTNLYSIPGDHSLVYREGLLNQRLLAANLYIVDQDGKEIHDTDASAYRIIAEKIDTRSYLTVPIYHRHEISGRLFLLSRTRKFNRLDIDFLRLTVRQFMPIIENIRLVDHLATTAAEDERKKIAHDIHDSIIQPYIGLQLGIDSVFKMLNEDSASEEDFVKKQATMNKRMKHLRDLTEHGIVDLRSYISGLSKPRGFEASLLPALNGFASRFTTATGIEVGIESAKNIQITDRLAAELFQIVVEALSNIRRHTSSQNALITIDTVETKLYLAIENDNEDNTQTNFTPRSISERVEMLGGFLEVKQIEDRIGIFVEIPL